MEVPESLERYSVHVHVHRMVYALITKHQSKYLVLINVRPFDQSFSTGLNALHARAACTCILCYCLSSFLVISLESTQSLSSTLLLTAPMTKESLLSSLMVGAVNLN